MKSIKLIILIAVVILFSIGFVSLFFSYFSIVDRWVLPFNVTVVTGGVGLITDTTIPLQMGGVSQGGFSERRIGVGNAFDYPVRVILDIEGVDKIWLWKNNPRIVQPGQTENVSIRFAIPDNAEPGDYRGNLIFTLYRVWNKEEDPEDSDQTGPLPKSP